MRQQEAKVRVEVIRASTSPPPSPEHVPQAFNAFAFWGGRGRGGVLSPHIQSGEFELL